MAQFTSAAKPNSFATLGRRRRMCIIDAESPSPAAIESISGRGAHIRTNARPKCGDSVGLQHPAIGRIEGRVRSVGDKGVEIAFAGDEASVAFALGVTIADMTRD